MAKIVQRGDSTSPTRRQVAKRSSFAGFSMNKLVSDAKTPLLVLGGMWLGRKTYIALTQNSTVSGIFGVDGKKLAVPIAQILGGLTFSQLVKNKDWAPIGWGFAVSGGLQIIKDTFNKDILAGFLGETPEAANFELPELDSKMMGLGEPDLSMEELDKELERAIKEEKKISGVDDDDLEGFDDDEQIEGFFDEVNRKRGKPLIKRFNPDGFVQQVRNRPSGRYLIEPIDGFGEIEEDTIEIA